MAPSVGQLMLEAGLVTGTQLEAALERQRALETYAPIGHVLVEQRAITRAQLNAILDRYGKRPRLGGVLLAAKAINEAQLQGALTYHRKTNLRLGEALLQLGILTEEEIKHAVSMQLNVPFVRLEDFTPDPGVELDRLIPKGYAEKHRVLPIAKARVAVTVAMDDPTDASVVDELPTLIGCSIDIVACTRRGFLRAFVKVYQRPIRALLQPTPLSSGDWALRGVG